MSSEKDSTVTKRKHFAKLHERIQNKYNEMQKRLEKSKSVDCLTSIGENNVLKESASYTSENDLSMDDVFVQNKRSSHPVMHTVIVEDVDKQEVTFSEIGYKEASVSESEFGAINSKDGSEYDENSVINNWSISSESLNELEKKWDENTSPPSTPKLSIKNKIGSRFTAARERRREEKERERNKKKEVLENAPKAEKIYAINQVRPLGSEVSRLKTQPATRSDERERHTFIFSNTSKADVRLTKDKKVKLATVTIALIEITGLETDTEERQRVVLCRFKLGSEKWKSKSAKNVTTQSTAKWQELISLHMYEEVGNLLEVVVFDESRKDAFVGKTVLDLSEMEKEKTHVIKTVLEGVLHKAEIFFLLTISGTPFDDLMIDIDNYLANQTRLDAESEHFAFYHLKDLETVGRLSVIVYGAKGLAASDCYCSLRLINERRQTHTENKTNEPNWMKSFTFTVTDITSILEVIVYDEKRDEVGRMIIPLLNINNGAKVWYALKDHTMRERAKGNNPRILLEMRISWNIIKASLRAIKPKEPNYLDSEDRFDRKLFLKNVSRAKVVVLWVLDFLRTLKACFEWESRKANTIGLICWLLFNWYFGAWMLPLIVLVPFVWYRPHKYFLIDWRERISPRVSEHAIPEQRNEKEEKITLRQKINNIQDLIQSVQNFIGQVASMGESVKNLYNFSVPFLSLLAIFFLVTISLIIYLIPLQYILMAWGIKKYVRKIIWPDRQSHSEVMDLLSRVPDDDILMDCDKLPLDNKLHLRFDNTQVHD